MIKIVTDSTCDLPIHLFQQYDITVVPINIQFGTETYQEGITMDRPTFYRKIEEMGIIPTTSQPSAGQFVEVYRRVAAEGATSILSLHLTSKRSGTYQSAELARSMLPELDIHVFDTLSLSAGLGFSVLEAARAIEAGKSVDEILQRLEIIRDNLRIFLTPATLKYLQMSGRVGKLSGALASLLNVKPIIVVEDGLLDVTERVRTRRKALERLLELTEEAHGKDPINLAVVHAETPDEAQDLMERARARLNCVESFVEDLATSLAVHGGPGIIGVISYKV
ncbi:MAG TPA: DegV family protein [Anaerolineae bacterium]|nr:DegV family protein [Anaerolineae bacterium]